MKVEIPLRTVSALNAREHYYSRARRVNSERASVSMVLATKKTDRPQLPCEVVLTRIAPSNGLDPHDNLPSAFKGTVDAISDWFNVDDRSPLLRFRFEQERGPWGIRIEAETW